MLSEAASVVETSLGLPIPLSLEGRGRHAVAGEGGPLAGEGEPARYTPAHGQHPKSPQPPARLDGRGARFLEPGTGQTAQRIQVPQTGPHWTVHSGLRMSGSETRGRVGRRPAPGGDRCGRRADTMARKRRLSRASCVEQRRTGEHERRVGGGPGGTPIPSRKRAGRLNPSPLRGEVALQARERVDPGREGVDQQSPSPLRGEVVTEWRERVDPWRERVDPGLSADETRHATPDRSTLSLTLSPCRARGPDNPSPLGPDTPSPLRGEVALQARERVDPWRERLDRTAEDGPMTRRRGA